jgi:DNA polymerase III delta prime subunit
MLELRLLFASPSSNSNNNDHPPAQSILGPRVLLLTGPRNSCKKWAVSQFASFEKWTCLFIDTFSLLSQRLGASSGDPEGLLLEAVARAYQSVLETVAAEHALPRCCIVFERCAETINESMAAGEFLIAFEAAAHKIDALFRGGPGEGEPPIIILDCDTDHLGKQKFSEEIDCVIPSLSSISSLHIDSGRESTGCDASERESLVQFLLFEHLYGPRFNGNMPESFKIGDFTTLTESHYISALLSRCAEVTKGSSMHSLIGAVRTLDQHSSLRIGLQAIINAMESSSRSMIPNNNPGTQETPASSPSGRRIAHVDWDRDIQRLHAEKALIRRAVDSALFDRFPRKDSPHSCISDNHPLIKAPPTGILLHGPPGTGKTLLARAVATYIVSGGPSQSISNSFSDGTPILGQLDRIGDPLPSYICTEERPLDQSPNHASDPLQDLPNETNSGPSNPSIVDSARCTGRFIVAGLHDIVHGTIGDTERALRTLFDEALASAPSVIFIDEIDAIVGVRRSGVPEDFDIDRRDDVDGDAIGGIGAGRIASLLSEEMDRLFSLNGVGPRPRVLLLAATNHISAIPVGLCRIGRFDLVLSIDKQ